MSTKRSRRRRRAAKRPAQAQAPELTATERTPEPARHPYRSRGEEAPPAIWAPLPLTEILIGGGIVLALLGLLLASGARQEAMIGGGVLFVAFASAELSWREHAGGYRSHTMLLAALAAFLVTGLCWLAWRVGLGLPRTLLPVIWMIVFGLAAWQLRDLFRRRSGGVGFRV